MGVSYADRRLEANRRNARHSTGPRSEAGKARSSRNALKHGLSSQDVVIFGEDPDAFDELREDLFLDLEPVGALEEQLVETIAACIWRLRRIPEIEAGVFAFHRFCRDRDRAKTTASELTFGFVNLVLTAPLDSDADAHAAAIQQQSAAEKALEGHLPIFGEVFCKAQGSLANLARYEAAIERSLFRTLAQLRECQEARRERQGQASTIIEMSDDRDPPTSANE